ncbi:precorrin-6y C5,15-methyltransferase (decarboxylating) subunit CbiE [Denitromonas halophila]|uniref:Precorrin-6y C5,15-methyltransferase (Decarboxylating) subunit CbiE n=1 Tax=Denitromonas halophila TaxID=1629404 RepID=A0A557QW66_9RHOO|nr:precorrin-6y C5,15-methyltransferase (decarboxylating) subunit CbiE [Denitromonas halophila]TVO57155.1 precorrin-6y C5,15-methyltransferase (decarboxylating) subunit CbiE [Denitromonas halophila]
MSEHCTLVGILDDGWAGLSDAARQRLATAGLVIGAARTLALLERHLPGTATVRPMDGALGKVPEWIAQAHADGLSTVVLATGDPLCHGMASFLVRKLGAAAVAVLPAPSTLQLLFARLKKPWQDVIIGSVHSRDAGEWIEGAAPDHGLYRLVRQVAEHPRVAAFTGPENSPDRIARALLAAGFDGARISVASRLCLPDEAVFTDLPLPEAAAMRFDDPNVVLIERDSNAGRAVFGFDDLDYVQRSPEKGLITKLEARAVSLAKLALRGDSVVWDIGAGSGSVGLEASRIARHGHVWAIEKNDADAANARENARRFNASNYTLVQARAPEHIDTWPDPDAVFIGGSGGELAALIALILTRLKPGGRLVMNFVTIENLATATATLVGAGARWDVTQLSAARSQPILDMHRLAAQNPVWIVTAHKESA